MTTHGLSHDALLGTLGIDRHSRRRRWLWRGLVLAGVLGAVASLIYWRGRGGSSAPAFVTQPARHGTMTVRVTATGALEPEGAVDVGAEISGRIARVLVDDNQTVHQGQLLAVLDRELLLAQARQADAQVAVALAARRQAEVTLADTQRDVARAEELHRRGVSAASELDTVHSVRARAHAALASAEAQQRAARAAADFARTTLARTEIHSPIDGVVLVRNVEPGQTVVAALQAPVLFKLARDIRHMRLVAQIDEADIGSVRAGQVAHFTVAAYPERTFDAVVTSVRSAPTSLEAVITYEAELAVDNVDGALRPGMTATVTLDTARYPDRLVVPNAALRFRVTTPRHDGTGQVHVLRGGRAVPIEVVLGATSGEETIIQSGALGAGEAVVTEERR